MGIEWIFRKDGVIVLHQSSYISELEARHHPPTHLVATPTYSSVSPNGARESQLMTPAGTTSYRALVGALQYLATRTRIDVAYAVTSLAHHMQQPTLGHMKDAMRALQYLCCTRSDGIFATPARFMGVKVYADAAWISDKEANTWMGYIVFLNRTPIMWRALLSDAKYPSVSSAEYTAVSNGWGRAEQVKRLLQSVGIHIPPVPVYSDSQVAITNVVSGKCLEAVRHLLLRYHRVRAAHQSGDILITHVPSAEQLADVLTKPLGRLAFQRCKHALMCVDGKLPHQGTGVPPSVSASSGLK